MQAYRWLKQHGQQLVGAPDFARPWPLPQRVTLIYEAAEEASRLEAVAQRPDVPPDVIANANARRAQLELPGPGSVETIFDAWSVNTTAEADLPAPRVHVPHEAGYGGSGLWWGNPSDDALERFLALSAPVGAGSDEDVARFVRRFGPLGLAAHGAPAQSPNAVVTLFGAALCEKVDWYRLYARVLAATLRTAARSNAGHAPHVGDVGVLAELFRFRSAAQSGTLRGDPLPIGETELLLPLGDHALALTAETARILISAVVQWWMWVGHVSPAIEWEAIGEARTYWQGGLWGELGTSVMYTITRGARTPVCYWCGKDARKDRAPKRGQRASCGRPACERMANAEHKREQRARERQARERRDG